MRRLGVACAAGALLVGATACVEDEQSGTPGAPFYQGKTIELIVPFAAGGGTDAVGRALADMLHDTIEGSPTVQVVNVEGADGLLGHNQFAAETPDGLTLFLGGGSGNIYELFGATDKQFSYADWEPLVGVHQGTAFYASPSVVSSVQDLVDPPAELRFGSGSAEGSDLARLFVLDWVGAKFRPIFGYEGAGAARTAFQQGETNLGQDTTAQFNANVKPLVEANEAIPLMSMGMIVGGSIERDPGLPDLPSAAEVYEELRGSAPSGVEFEAMKLLNGAVSLNKILFMSKATPQAAQDALRAAVPKLSSHPRYAEYKASSGPFAGYDITIGDDLTELFDTIFGGDNSAAIAYIREYALDRYQARIGTE